MKFVFSQLIRWSLQKLHVITNIETVSCPCNTCFWYARALAVRNTSRGGAEWRIFYSQRPSISKTRIAWTRDRFYFLLLIYMRFLTIFYARKHGTPLYCGLRQWASLSMGRVLKYSQTNGIDELFSVILRLNVHEILAFVYILLNKRCQGNHLYRIESFISASAN